MIRVQCRLPFYEIDGVDTVGPIDGHMMIVECHPIRRDLVILRIGDHSYAVKSDDLIAATENTQNTAR